MSKMTWLFVCLVREDCSEASAKKSRGQPKDAKMSSFVSKSSTATVGGGADDRLTELSQYNTRLHFHSIHQRLHNGRHCARTEPPTTSTAPTWNLFYKFSYVIRSIRLFIIGWSLSRELIKRVCVCLCLLCSRMRRETEKEVRSWNGIIMMRRKKKWLLFSTPTSCRRIADERRPISAKTFGLRIGMSVVWVDGACRAWVSFCMFTTKHAANVQFPFCFGIFNKNVNWKIQWMDTIHDMKNYNRSFAHQSREKEY